MIIETCGYEHVMHEDEGALKPLLNCIWSQTAIACIFICSLLYFFFSVLLSSQLHAYKKKTESCSRYVALAKYCVTCQLNTFQEEPQKLKIFLRTMNVSEDYCDRITTCDRLIIWNWFCAHTNAWLFFALLSLFLLLFETANAFAACLIFFLSPPPPPFSLCLFYLPSFGL